MKGKVINVEPGTWPKDKKPFWAVSVAQEGKEPIKLYASTKEIGEGLQPGQVYDFTLKTTGKEGQPLKYPYITEAVKITSIGGPTDTAHTDDDCIYIREPDPLDAELAGKPPTKPVALAQPSKRPPSSPFLPNGTDLRIARQVALKAAVEDLKGVQHTPQEVIDTAKFFAEWLEA